MADKKTALLCLTALKIKGADKAIVVLSETLKHELNVEQGRISLLRTTDNLSLSATAIVGERRGSYKSNRVDPEAVEKTAQETVDIARACPPDPAYEIAEKQPAEEFEYGPAEPDRDAMFDRLSEFIAYAAQNHPRTIIRQARFEFTRLLNHFLNSNGVDFVSRRSYYYFSVMFASKKGTDTSSFNYTGCCLADLGKPLAECGTIAECLARSGEEIAQKALEGKFEGDIVIAPDALDMFIGLFCDYYLTDMKLIEGTSLLKGSLDTPVAVPTFTLRSMPRSPDLAFNYFLTQDGYKAKNTIIIDRGVLKTFLLSLYGARKTGRKRADTDGGCFVVDPGTLSRDELIGAVKRGVYVRRVSGGMPNDRGDFAFIAKNSFLIENGRITRPVNESMISGNIFDLFKNITGISKESVNFGTDIYPWVRAAKLVISGK
jgi:PmbA protein